MKTRKNIYFKVVALAAIAIASKTIVKNVCFRYILFILRLFITLFI